jgi:clan AA aspartic protease (TIGR02281 family)
MRNFAFYLVLASLLLSSCGEKKQRPSFYDYSSAPDTAETELTDEDSVAPIGEEDEPCYTVIPVPYTDYGGIKKIDVKVNSVPMKMIFDTGCSSALISVVEANFLYKNGYLSDDDIKGVVQAQIADGSIVENTIINLKELAIGDLVCTDVEATVSNNCNAPLLLGNAVLDRVSSFTIDNENHIINFRVRTK